MTTNQEYKKAVQLAVLVLAAVLVLIYAMHGDQQALNEGFIH